MAPREAVLEENDAITTKGAVREKIATMRRIVVLTMCAYWALAALGLPAALPLVMTGLHPGEVLSD